MTQTYCRDRAQDRKLILNQLEEKVLKYSNMSRDKISEVEKEIWSRTVSDLQILRDEFMQGVIFRCGVKWYNEGEAMSKYFLNLEKSRSRAKGMNSVITDSGEEIHEPNHIIYKQVQFYSKLHAKEETKDFNFQNTDGIYIPHAINNKMAGIFTKTELVEAIRSMKRGLMV